MFLLQNMGNPRDIVVLCHIAEFVEQSTPMKPTMYSHTPAQIVLRASVGFHDGNKMRHTIRRAKVMFLLATAPGKPPCLFHGRNAFRLFIGERAKSLLTSSCILIDSEAHEYYYSCGKNSPILYTPYFDLPLV